MPAGVGARRRTVGVGDVAVLFGSSGKTLLLAGVLPRQPQAAAAVLMGGGSRSALFLSWAACHPEELTLARIADDGYATASDSPACPGSPGEPAGWLCNWETAQASEPGGRDLPAGPGWNALISNRAWSLLVCGGSGSAGLDAVPGGLCLSSGKPSCQDQGTTGYYRTAAAEIPVQFPGNGRAIQRLGSCAGPGTQMAACCAWHL